MSVVWMWVRASWQVVLPVLALAQLAAMVNVQPLDGIPVGWRADWSWMLSVLNGATLLVSPASAALVVALTLRYFGPDVQEGLPGGVPRWRPIAHIALAVLLQGFGVQVIALVIGSSVCWLNGASTEGLTLPWQLVTGPAALLAAVALGAAVAALVPTVWSVPVVLFGVFLAHRVFFWHGYPELFTTEMATWMVDGGRPLPSHLAATVGLNLAVATSLWSGLVFLIDPRGRRALVALVVCLLAVGLAAAIYTPFVLNDAMDTYERVS